MPRAYSVDFREKVLQHIEKHPDYFLSEITDYFSVTPQTIFYALKRLKITRKKKLLAIRKEMKRNGKLL